MFDEGSRIETRPARIDDRERAAALLGDARPLDAPDCHVHVSAAGPDSGVVVWREPAPSETPELGALVLPPGATRQQLYALALACAAEARALGHTAARFRVQDERLLSRLQRDFTIDPKPCGWEPNTGRAVEWEITVDLDDALRQLRQVL